MEGKVANPPCPENVRTELKVSELHSSCVQQNVEECDDTHGAHYAPDSNILGRPSTGVCRGEPTDSTAGHCCDHDRTNAYRDDFTKHRHLFSITS